MRNSTREARRWTLHNILSAHSAELEARLATVNRELSLAREFLSSQTRDLDYLGRSASERISSTSNASILVTLTVNRWFHRMRQRYRAGKHG